MSTMHKSAVAHIGAPPAVTWEAVTVRLWPNWAAAGFHGPARDDQQMRFSMHHGSGAGRSEWTLLVTPAGGGRSVINCEWVTYDVGWLAAAALGKKSERSLNDVAQTIRQVAEEMAATR